MKKLSLVFALIFTVIISINSEVLADQQQNIERIGRISYISGDTFFRNKEGSGIFAGIFNYPVSTGNVFTTGNNGILEIQIGSQEIRIDKNSQLNIIELDDNATQIYLSQGTINIHLEIPPLYQPLRVKTPMVEINITQAGHYRIDAGHNDYSSSIAVLDGKAELLNSEHSVIASGIAAILSGNPPQMTVQTAYSTPFDEWSIMREHKQTDIQSPRYIYREVTGIENLDQYGEWSQSSYGLVWYPSQVAADWSPHRYPNEISGLPWGFAPSHYGKWVNTGNRWGWCPENKTSHSATSANIPQENKTTPPSPSNKPVQVIPPTPQIPVVVKGPIAGPIEINKQVPQPIPTQQPIKMSPQNIVNKPINPVIAPIVQPKQEPKISAPIAPKNPVKPLGLTPVGGTIKKPEDPNQTQ